ncbi:hypothetical protein F5Y09DRAFT_353292 [Xylaria sp. FL1042]|nr:hypothetical protein F5Y09DRAFT_353292 [Xylaria sp. FL1042]
MSTAAESPASNSSTSVPLTSTRKKRIACDNCHFSKVRCTGETSGCQRCERGGKSCHYSESNMGRMPPGGVNKRRKSTVHKNQDVIIAAGPPLQRQSNDWNSPSPFEIENNNRIQDDREHALPSATLGDKGSPDLPVDDCMSLWDESSGPSQQDQLKPLLANTGGDLDILGFDPLISTFDDIDFSEINDGHFEIEGCPIDLDFPQLSVGQSSHPSPTTSHKPPEPQQQPSPIALRSRLLEMMPSSTIQTYRDSNYGTQQAGGKHSSSKNDTQYWTTQLEELSSALEGSPIPLDGMLHHSSRVLPRAKEALQSLQSGEGSSSSTNLILILVCLTQMTALFEHCVPAVLAGRSTTGSSDLTLRLGDFQVDRTAQHALQMHVVGKELSGMLQISKLIKQTLLRADWRHIPKRTHDVLLEDLRVRTVMLVYQMKQKRAPSRIILS